MASLGDLRFSQKFPFSSTAKRVVKELDLSLDDVSEDVLGRAKLMVSNASTGKRNFSELYSTELLENEILAFPVAKILLSLQNNPLAFQKFCQMVSDSVFFYLEKESKKLDVGMFLSKDLDFSVELCDNANFCVSIPLADFLKIDFFRPNMKLVNQNLSSGRIFLDENGFSRFVAEMAYVRVLGSMPVPVRDVPKKFMEIAKSLSQQAVLRQKMDFEFQLQGKVNPNAFPPCYAEFYQQLLDGKNLPHLARFSIATFLSAAGMPVGQIVDLFRKTPNFSEKMTSYQVNRISKAKLSPPSCAKIKEYGLCNFQNCGAGNPLGYYRGKFSELKKLEEAEKKDSEKNATEKKEALKDLKN